MLLPHLLVLSLAATPGPTSVQSDQTSVMATVGGTFRGFGEDPSVNLALRQELGAQGVFGLVEVGRAVTSLGTFTLERTAVHFGLGAPLLHAGVFTAVAAVLLGMSVEAQSAPGVTYDVHPAADLGLGLFGEFSLSRHWALVVRIAPRAVLPARAQTLDANHAFRESVFQLESSAGVLVKF